MLKNSLNMQRMGYELYEAQLASSAEKCLFTLFFGPAIFTTKLSQGDLVVGVWSGLALG